MYELGGGREGNRRWRVEAEEGGGLGGEEERRESGWDRGMVVKRQER